MKKNSHFSVLIYFIHFMNKHKKCIEICMSDKLYENQIQLEKYVLDIKSNMLEITKMTSNQKQMNPAL